MDEELFVDKDYLKGFNHGYVFAEHQPQYAKMLAQKTIPDNEYFSGFKAGRDEYGFEKTKDMLKGLPDNHSGPDKSKDMDKSK